MSVTNVVTFCALVILWILCEVEAAVCGSEGEIVGVIHVPSLGSEVGSLEEEVRGSTHVLLFLFPHKRNSEAGRIVSTEDAWWGTLDLLCV